MAMNAPIPAAFDLGTSVGGRMVSAISSKGEPGWGRNRTGEFWWPPASVLGPAEVGLNAVYPDSGGQLEGGGITLFPQSPIGGEDAKAIPGLPASCPGKGVERRTLKQVRSQSGCGDSKKATRFDGVMAAGRRGDWTIKFMQE